MALKFDGMNIEEIAYVNKVPYKFHTVSETLTTNETKEYDAKMNDYYTRIFGLRGLGILRRMDDFSDRAIYYVSIPKIYIKDKLEKFYQLYDVINLKDSIDRGRGKDLILSLAHKGYEFKIFKDYGLDKLYIYVQTQEGTEVSVNE